MDETATPPPPAPVTAEPAAPVTAPPSPPLPPVRSNTGMRPAMVVGGLAVLILALFIGLGLATTPSHPVTVTTAKATRVAGSAFEAIPADPALHPILLPGEPPANILNAVTLPVGAVARSHQNNGSEGDQYDEQVTFTLNGSETAAVDFYRTEMARLGWSIFSIGAAAHSPGSVEILGKKAGTDSWYWEMGAVVSPTSFADTSANGGRGTTNFTIRLLQLPDPD